MAMTVLLIVHGLVAVALLGAITHQAVGAWTPAAGRPASFVARFRAAPPRGYTGAVVVLYLATFVLGGIIYTHYRITVRIVIEQLQIWSAHGAFELKEHFLAIGLGLLPVYWHLWRQPAGEHGRARSIVTLMLAFVVWWGFLVGHILNNLRGFGL